MIAPERSPGKGLAKVLSAGDQESRLPIGGAGCGNFARRNHGFVRPIIKRPHFGQAHAKLNRDTKSVASGPGLDRIPDSSAPQPPGVRTDRARVLVRLNPQFA
jgi:hypothetical protein